MLPGSLLQHIWTLQIKADFHSPAPWQVQLFLFSAEVAFSLAVGVAAAPGHCLRTVQRKVDSARGSLPWVKAAPADPSTVLRGLGHGDQSLRVTELVDIHPGVEQEPGTWWGRGLSASICLLPGKSAETLKCRWPVKDFFADQSVRMGVQGSPQKECRTVFFRTCDLFSSFPLHPWLNVFQPALALISNYQVWLSHSESFIPRKYCLIIK